MRGCFVRICEVGKLITYLEEDGGGKEGLVLSYSSLPVNELFGIDFAG